MKNILTEIWKFKFSLKNLRITNVTNVTNVTNDTHTHIHMRNLMKVLLSPGFWSKVGFIFLKPRGVVPNHLGGHTSFSVNLVVGQRNFMFDSN